MTDGKKLMREMDELLEDIQKNHDALVYLNMQHNRMQEKIKRIRELIRKEKAYEQEQKSKFAAS